MFQSYGGRGTGEATAYVGKCWSCGLQIDHLPGNCDGRRASAIAEWNRMSREGKTT